MSCNVCIGAEDYESDDFYSNKEVIARKPHRCCECKRTIAKGDKYIRDFGKFDGAMFAEKSCLLCAEIRSVFTCAGGASPIYGGLWAEMREYAFPELTTAGECFRELSPGAKEFVLEKWRMWKGLDA